MQNAFQPMQTNFVTLINDNKVYSLNKGALFANFAPSTYKISSVAGVAAQDVGFDLNSKSVLCFNGANYAPLGTNAPELKNMNAEMTWVGGYAGGRSIVMALFRKADGSGSLMKLNGQYGFLAGFSSPLIMSQQTLTATHGLMQSSLVAGNYDGDYVYYVVGNSIYRTDVATAAETLQITIPAGETVTCMQHIKYPQPASASVVNTLNYMAIATYANGRYKVWLHNISSTGNIEPQTAPRFEGEGRVSNVTYMEQGMGSRTF
ncbi:hypothetical protein MKQ70_15405 [Chitinophaga sedimenti]|uniref:hypothetical protein n=1 Tax=Chitinophaga sedimenti TaxID=2033606 RepID=UPI0020051F3C|nr:hypothetical protein [Chitinophaga sedimenti]MCK7556328.1 hypothetical protein [Chitinophaga sedimenti]